MLPQHSSSEYFLPITTQILYAAQNSQFVFRSIWSTTFLSYLLSCLSIHALMLSFSPSCIFLFALSQSLFSITLSIYISLCLSVSLSQSIWQSLSLFLDLFSGSLSLSISFIPFLSLRYSKMVSVWLQRAALHPDISHIMKRRIYLHWGQQVRVREKGELRGMLEI